MKMYRWRHSDLFGGLPGHWVHFVLTWESNKEEVWIYGDRRAELHERDQVWEPHPDNWEQIWPQS